MPTPAMQMIPPKSELFPNRNYLIFLDNPLLLGNESDGWNEEAANITSRIAAAINLERYAASDMNDPIKEGQEFEYLVEVAEAEEGNADKIADEGGDVYESITVTKKNTNNELNSFWKALSLSSMGNKPALFA
jgi:hypothetical protein